ncbi:thioesterase thiol ester dehydrase-isomerase [Pyrrhoderma noxium]|uniref:Thioesterase thiol ester dehydrase-isomerase n=1 Tax=Pyrrhoderma noxium TaxID=2282107 RepID=A0A286UL08_9AGAM|nr:thioesterase thiol ester dehydrase-isomerase [Pyrrhoderma noxium]
MSPSKRSTPKDYFYFLSYRTRWSDNDQYSHVNNSVYYHLIDSIVNTYLSEHCGCIPTPSSTTQSSESLPPIGLVVSSYCNFFEPFSFPETITLGFRVTKLGRSSVSYEIGFFSGDQETLLSDKSKAAKAVGGYTHVFVDRTHRRPVKVMDVQLREGLQKALIMPPERNDKAKL